jgi:type I restriction enzyme S subunit
LKLPVGWLYRRLKYVADIQVSNVDKKSVEGEQPVRLCNYVDVYKNDTIAPGMLFMEATALDSQIANFALKKGDVLITKDSEEWDDIAVPAVVTEDMPDVLCGYHLARIRPNPKLIEGRFLARCFAASGIAEQFNLAANGITRFGLGKDEITGGWFPIPPLETQRRIADYLDRETMRIDGLIAAKERLLAILAEKRRALITHVVTRGLNPAVPLRDSGLPWLGMIPEHWELTRLKFLGEVRTGLTIGKDYGARELQDYPYLRVANVQDGYLVLDDVTTVAVPEEEARSCALAIGDVLMNEGGDIDKLGRGCVWRGEISQCLHQNHVFCVRPHSVDPEWLATWTATLPAKSYFEARAKRTTNLASISSTNISELPVPLPPRNEQQAIMRFVIEGYSRVDSMSAATLRTADLLRERRAALIAAAVTGQLAVER